MGSCNTLNNLSNKVGVPVKTEDLILTRRTGIFYVNVNVNLMVENGTMIKSEILINVGVSAKV